MTKNLVYIVAAAAGGVLIGGAITYVATSQKGMPQLGEEANTHLARIKLRDTVQSKDLTLGAVFSITQEDIYVYYTLGYGLLGKAPNDVIMELVNNTTTKSWLANFAKLGNNAVDVYVDNVLQATLPATGGVPAKSVQPAFVWVNV